MPINEYLKQIKKGFSSGISTEHSYRPALQNLLHELVKGITVTNEPKRQKCGAPDFIIQRKDVPIGYIEAKDIGENLNNPTKSDQEQKDRYLTSLNNIIFTDYLEFHFYKYGKKVKEIKIASIEDDKVKTHLENFDSFKTYIKDFCDFKGQTIKSAEKLAEMMAQKARIMEEVLYNAVKEHDKSNTLVDQLKAFRQILIHDLDEKTFSDIYAQTIAYGLFAARLHDKNPDDFKRQKARDLIPKSNPFLRNLFDYVSGAQLDDRVVWIVDDLAEIFRATDLESILADFGKATQQDDPFIHFYETFLAEYDPQLRKSRGVYYTPKPVVNFIVRAVDDILKTEFNLPQGLADSSKTRIKIDVQGKKVEKEVHRVQILDPATGTGTFLAEVVKQIHKKFAGQKGIWSNYVETHLLPRLNGFEILMAPYAMAHLKLDLLLAETGYKPTKDQRFRVYLTNSLEEHHLDTGTLFANWLSAEANEANHIKRDTPVMVVMGNPPYAVSSSNKSVNANGEKTWIGKLIDDYKKDLKERKINLDDDYIKFIRYGQYYIDKNGSGVLSYISNNSFIDGITHRQMRKQLLESFDKIYILDLHGNAKKKEVCPDGSPDQNVFDIMQGVSINIFIKTCKKKKNELGQVFHCDVQGKREFKYETLIDNSISTIKWKLIKCQEPTYYFVPRNTKSEKEYIIGFSINSLFLNSNSGIETKNDGLTTNTNIGDLEKVISNFKRLSVEELKRIYSLTDTSGWTVKKAKDDIINNRGAYYKIYYRPFDMRNIYMTEKSGGFIGRPRLDTMCNFLKGDNLGLIFKRGGIELLSSPVFISKNIIDRRSWSRPGMQGAEIIAPLYIFTETNGQQTIGQSSERTPNLNSEIVKQITEKLRLSFTDEKETSKNTFAPIDILDYIYAVLHSPTYREKYKEFLKIDFPRVPYPEDIKIFWKLIKLGAELRQIHLLESPVVEKYITRYPKSGNNIVDIIRFDITKDTSGKVWINDAQYFDKVPIIAWEFYIGGYQPAQKWLKDRKGRELSSDDIFHYQKIIVALNETDRIMKEIDKVVKL